MRSIGVMLSFVGLFFGASGMVRGGDWRDSLPLSSVMDTERVSASSQNNEAGNDETQADSYLRGGPKVCPNEPRYVVFSSKATNLDSTVRGLRPGSVQVYLRDRVLGHTIIVSALNGAAGDGDSQYASVSKLEKATRRLRIVFQSNAEDLRLGAKGTQVLMWEANLPPSMDISENGTPVRSDISVVSTNTNGDPANDWSGHAAISPDGWFVAFDSNATNLALDANGNPADDDLTIADIFVKSIATGKLVVASADTRGRIPSGVNVGASIFPCIAEWGRYVAFETVAKNFHPDPNDPQKPDPNYPRDDASPYKICRKDLGVRGDNQAGPIELVTINRQGTNTGAGLSLYSSISQDGTRVAFMSRAQDLLDPNLYPAFGFPNGYSEFNVYVRDFKRGQTWIASVDPREVKPGDANSANPCLAGNGKAVVFETRATNLILDDTSNDVSQVVVRLLEPVNDQSRVYYASVSSWMWTGETQKANGNAILPSVGTTAQNVAFISDADNLVPGGKTLGGRTIHDVYVRYPVDIRIFTLPSTIMLDFLSNVSPPPPAGEQFRFPQPPGEWAKSINADRATGVNPRLTCFVAASIEQLKQLTENRVKVVILAGYDTDDLMSNSTQFRRYLLVRGYDRFTDSFEVIDSNPSAIQSDVRQESAERIERIWSQFGRSLFIVVAAPMEGTIGAILGPTRDDPESMWQKGVEMAESDLQQNDQNPYAWFTLGTSVAELACLQDRDSLWAEAETYIDRAFSLGLPIGFGW